MTTTTPRAPAAALPGPLRMTWLHLKYQFLETVRVPVAVLGNLLFPALAMFFFVVPQKEVAQNPLAATMAVASLGLFAICSASLFTYGRGVAEDRQLPFDPFVRTLPAGPAPRMAARGLNGGVFSLFGRAPVVLSGWLFRCPRVLFPICSASLFPYALGVAEDRQLPFDPFVRTLPAGPAPRMAARVLSGGVFSLFGLVPLVLIAWLFTDASVTWGQLLAGVGTVLLVSVPFVLLGMAIGYSLSAKAALPVVQVILFPLAFAGGLFL